MSLNVFMNCVPDSVCSRELSRNSRSCWTCGASSEPYVAVAIRHPPPLDDLLVSTTHCPFLRIVPVPQFGSYVSSGAGSDASSDASSGVGSGVGSGTDSTIGILDIVFVIAILVDVHVQYSHRPQ